MKIRPIRVEGDIAFVTLTKGLVAIIDADDAERVGTRNWYGCKNKLKFYAESTKLKGEAGVKTIRLHHFITGLPAGQQIDHENCDGLDNRKANLRAASHGQNCQNRPKQSNNSSGFKGVSWSSSKNGWKAQIRADRRRHDLGIYATKEAAAAAYHRAAVSLHGEFARV